MFNDMTIQDMFFYINYFIKKLNAHNKAINEQANINNKDGKIHMPDLSSLPGFS